MTKRLKRPRDPAQLAKLVMDIATGEVKDKAKDTRDPAAVALGQKGGAARAAALSGDRKSEIAQKAAKAKWDKRKTDE